jgi:hypothetical protein
LLWKEHINQITVKEAKPTGSGKGCPPRVAELLLITDGVKAARNYRYNIGIILFPKGF